MRPPPAVARRRFLRPLRQKGASSAGTAHGAKGGQGAATGTRPGSVAGPSAARYTACMLDLMRRQSFLIYLIFGAIVGLFVINYGPGSGGCTANIQPKQWVARVNGTAIGTELFGWTLNRQYDDMQRRAQANGIAFDRVMAERIGIRRRVVDSLVDRRLIAAESGARGVRVSDGRLLKELRESYGVRGLTYASYEEHVGRAFNMSVEQFEAVVREDLASNYLMHALRDTVQPSEGELRQAFVREHERLQLRYARFPIDTSDIPQPSAEAAAVVQQAEPDALREAYDRAIGEFSTPAMVRTLQIVRTLDANAPVEQVAAARAELEDVVRQAEGGTDFAALVAKYSQDARSKGNGGDMGFFARDEVAPVLAEVAFNLPVNSMNKEPVRTPQGLHVLKKVEERAPGRKQFEDVQPDLAARVLKERVAASRAEKAADALRSALAAGGSFVRLTHGAQQDELTLAGLEGKKRRSNRLPDGVETGWLLRTDAVVPSLGEAPQVIEAAFAIKKVGDCLSRPMRVDDALIVVQLKAREHADLAAMADEREALEEAVGAQKRQRVLAAWLGQLRSQAKVELNPAYLQPAIPADAGADPPTPQGEEAAG